MNPRKKAKTKRPTTNETELFSCLRSHYPAKAYAVFPHVPDGTGAAAHRTADALVMSLWPSRGCELIGVEIKCNRPDWLKELKDPEKAEEVCQFCDRWYVLVADPDIVKEAELPPTWGLMRKYGKGVQVLKKAPKLEPIPIDRFFLAALLRKAQDQFQSDPLLVQRFKDGYQAAEGNCKRKVEYAGQRLERLQTSVKEFETASGLRISQWDAGDMGRVVRLIKSNGDVVTQTIKDMKRSAKTLRQKAESLELAAGELSK